MNVILFEMNEVPIRILDHYIERRPKSALARAVGGGRVYTTYAEDAGHLSPWVTWPSLHRGVANDKHYISDLGQSLEEVDRSYPPLWRILSNAGVRTGVFSSLHTYPLPGNLASYDFFVPDPFASGQQTHPKTIEPFQALNLTMSRQSGRNVSGGVPMTSATRLIASVPELGIRAKTMLDLAGQIAEERLARWKLVRRRTYQSVMSFDIFMRQIARTRPRFSTFFTNHVASAMHRYWAALFPDDWSEDNGYDEAWRSRFSSEIMFAMDKLDAMVGRLMAFISARPEWRLVIASSMGQAAVEVRHAATIVHVDRIDVLMTALGLQPHDWALRPAMVPQFNVTVEPDARARFTAHLNTFSVAGEPVVFRSDGHGLFSIDFGQTDLPDDAQVEIMGRGMTMAVAGLSNMEVQDRAGASAYHIPQGTLIVYDGIGATGDRPEISTLDVAPFVLSSLGVTPPAYMRPTFAL